MPAARCSTQNRQHRGSLSAGARIAHVREREESAAGIRGGRREIDPVRRGRDAAVFIDAIRAGQHRAASGREHERRQGASGDTNERGEHHDMLD